MQLSKHPDKALSASKKYMTTLVTQNIMIYRRLIHFIFNHNCYVSM